MPTSWNDSLDKKLLLELLRQNDVRGKNWPKVAESMGPGFTGSACQQRFQKIKITEGFGTAQDYEKRSGGGGTPNKPTPPRKQTINKRKDIDGTDNDYGANETPSKRKRAAKDLEQASGSHDSSYLELYAHQEDKSEEVKVKCETNE